MCGNNFPYKVKLKYQKERKLNMAAFLNFTKEKEKEENRVVQITISEIVPNPHQPRTEFDYNDISSLAESICQNGILQPLSVRKVDRGYELIAGERRLRAAKLVQLRYVPCIILDISARTSAVLALVENIQEDAGLKLGKAQSTIANKLRILKLSDEEKELITKFNLTERHARALLRLGSKEERLEIINRVIKFNLNVERTEQAIDEYIGKAKDKESYRKRSKVFQNVKIFVNTINKAVETMKAAGIPADSKKIQNEDYIEYRVKIPIMNGNKNF